MPPRDLGPSRPGRRGAHRGLALAGALVAAATTVFAGLAAADPVQTVTQTAQDPGTAGADTKYTPVARSIADAAKVGWRQVGGAVYPGDEAATKQPPPDGMGYSDTVTIPHTVDFFTIAFAPDNPDRGFAAGAACRDPNTPDTTDGLASCVRVPVIYSYTSADGWREVYRGDQQGFVGAIAWLPDGQTAMAVGGNGCYPRREVTCAANAPPATSPDKIAGDGLAWRFQDGAWSAVSQLPQGMTGMTALDFSPRAGDCGASVECGLAGGLGQVWMWKDGSFSTTYPQAGKPVVTEFSSTTPDRCAGTSEQCSDQPFRVRSIRFRPGSAGPTAVAVTAGCCYRDPTTGQDDRTADFPRLMVFNHSNWTVGGLFIGQGYDPRLATLRDSVYSVAFSNGPASPGQISVVASQGGGQTSPELSSWVGGPIAVNSSSFAGLNASDIYDPTRAWSETTSPELDSVHLAAGDGDLDQMAPTAPQQLLGGSDVPQGDGIIDWAVGEQKSTQPDVEQAVAYTTVGSTANTEHAPYPISCPGGSDLFHVSAQCSADANPTDQTSSGYVFSLPSYSLNAFTMVGKTGVAWAAGDRGALLTLGQGSQSAQVQPTKPPRLGGGQTTRLSNRQAYEGFTPPLSTEAGVVPPLASQPLRSSGDQLVAAGSPDPHPDTSRPPGISAMAMSRDGSEGWAVGPGALSALQATATLYHFDGSRWTNCDPLGSGALARPDPACESLAQLASAPQGAKILTVARVPLENGSDQSRADDFEAVALAVQPAGAASTLEFLRYRGGRWDIVPDWSAQVSRETDHQEAELAFSTPDDGWLITHGDQNQQLYHLAGSQWTKCDASGTPSPHYVTACADAAGILPTSTPSGARAGATDYATESGFVSGLHLLSVGKTVYLYGTRQVGLTLGGNATYYPMVLSYRAGDTAWTQEFDPDPADNPPNGGKAQPQEQGILNSLSLLKVGDQVEGWGIGDFSLSGALNTGSVRLTQANRTPLLRLDSNVWRFVQNPDPAASEYLLRETFNQSQLGGRSGREQVIALPGTDNAPGPVIAFPQIGSGGPVAVWLNPATNRWEGFPAPISGHTIGAAAPDNRGGFWAATTAGGTWFYHYTGSVHAPVFGDVANPARQPITATAAGGDGSLWVATNSNTVYRYDRVTGWDAVSLKGWDLGGAVQSPAYAIAVGNDGNGLVVGKSGRIADIGPDGAHLDPAAVLCSSQPNSCGGGHTLRSAAIASDGSALVGGDSRTLLWRPSGGSFSTTNAPPAASSATIAGISMPSPDRAWLVTNTGDVFVGSLGGGGWSWAREDVDSQGRLLTGGKALNGVAVDGAGHGYAVGDHGLILERSGDGSQPWQRLATGYREDLWSVTLGPGGNGALIGGDAGLVLTLVDGHFEVARSSDYFDPFSDASPSDTAGGVLGVALVPGYRSGDVEAWAMEGSRSRPTPGAILHYTNDPSNPLLAGGASRAQPISDAPTHRDGEFDIAAFGKSDCLGSDVCPEFTGSERDNEVIARRIRDALMTDDPRPDVAVFTGDVEDSGGYRNGNIVSGPTDESRITERWAELIADPLSRAGVPVYGAVGGHDLSNTQACTPLISGVVPCASTRQTNVGLNLAWRRAFAGQDAPWGATDPHSTNGLTFRPVSASGEVDPGQVADTSALPVSGARTHYAMDVLRGGTAVARLAFVDTSLKTLSGTAGVQNPVQDQLHWLDEVMSGRPDGEQAVVVSETPSYTYGSAGTGTDTLLDSVAFEALMAKDKVNAVVSGRLGWNGLYWLLAPGLHCPRPGGSYQSGPPSDPTQCLASNGALDNADQVAATVQGLNPSVPTPSAEIAKLAGGVAAPIPFVVAASAGGQFGPDGTGSGSAAQGFWHGYTMVRLFTDGHTPVVEQRPVFDWIGIQSSDHTLSPGRHMTLRGYGREPVGSDQAPRYDDIDSPAITHHYDLVLADPASPYLPAVDPSNTTENHYVPVPSSIGASIDPQTGEITYAGNGNHPPVYALGILSVGHQVATWPVVLAPKRSFVLTAPPVPRLSLPPLPRVEATAPATLPPPPGAQIPNPPQLNLTFPSPPSLPNLSLNAPQARPPAPPAPPPPPASPAATALEISPAPVGLNVAPPATVIPPPAPPIQPAPPSGARREARQRQAAVAKSEEGASQESATQEAGGSEDNSSQSASTRLDHPRDDLAFTALEHGGQPSAWPRDLLYGGGLGLAALTLALGWGLLRPKPRRREPELPAPAWNRSRSGRR